MEHGITLIAIVHIFVALLLITIVLLQDSKGGGMGGAFGGGASQTLFGATGAANFMVKLTRGLAVVFMLTCLGLTIFAGRRNSHSVVDTMPTTAAPSAQTGAPTQPVNGAAVPAPSAGNH